MIIGAFVGYAAFFLATGSSMMPTVDLDFGAGPFAKQHAVADFDINGDQLAGLITAAGADGNHLALGGLFSVRMMMPPADFSSASMRLTTTRS
jgi:hypothetical protein